MAEQKVLSHRVQFKVFLNPAKHFRCCVLSRLIQRTSISDHKDIAVVLTARPANTVVFPQVHSEFDVKRDFNAGPHNLALPLPSVTIAQVE